MGWIFNATPQPLYLWQRDPVPTVQEAGWTLRPVWSVQKISLPPGFDPRTVQPVTRHYTNWGIPAQNPLLHREEKLRKKTGYKLVLILEAKRKNVNTLTGIMKSIEQVLVEFTFSQPVKKILRLNPNVYCCSRQPILAPNLSQPNPTHAYCPIFTNSVVRHNLNYLLVKLTNIKHLSLDCTRSTMSCQKSVVNFSARYLFCLFIYLRMYIFIYLYGLFVHAVSSSDYRPLPPRFVIERYLASSHASSTLDLLDKCRVFVSVWPTALHLLSWRPAVSRAITQPQKQQVLTFSLHKF